MSTHIPKPDPDLPRRRFEDRLMRAWIAARDAVTAMEGQRAKDDARQSASDDALREKYGV